MTILKIYDIESGDIEDNLILVDEIEGDSNEECERLANERYGDTDKYAWSY